MNLNEVKTPLDQLEYDLTSGPLTQLILLVLIYEAAEGLSAPRIGSNERT